MVENKSTGVAETRRGPLQPVRVLILEDNASDAELMVRELRRSGLDPQWDRVDDEAAYVQLLASAPDVILSDYRMPGLDAPRALDLLRRLGLDTPFIVVSGAIGEDIAVSLMQNGASDYLLKDRLARLGPAVKRVLERKKLADDKGIAARELQSSESRFHLFMNNSPALAFIKDAEGRLLYMNDTCESMWGMRREDSLGKKDGEMWPPRTASELRGHDLEVLRGGGSSRVLEDVMLRDGRCLQLLSFRFIIEDAAGKRMLGGISVDIGEQLRTQKALASALRAKETLLREVHHRVKNNLQVISSLVNMQAETLVDPAAIRALDDIQKRVHAMALIHERLNGGDDLDRLDFGDYASVLAHDLFYSCHVDSERIRLRIETQPVLLDLNQAIPCGLILNELLSNALKYAFPNGRTGEVLVSVAPAGKDEVKITVSDNGVGLPKNYDPEQSQSLGLQIVHILARQLDGSVFRDPSAAGAFFRITFRRSGKV